MIESGAEIYFSHPAKVDASPLFFAIKSKNLKILELMCDKNDINLDEVKNSSGLTPILYASSLGIFDVINYLSVRGCNLNDSNT